MEDNEVCCKNCDRTVSISNYMIHSLHCESKIKMCQSCKEPIPLNDLENHIQKMHAFILCENCHESIEVYLLENHKKTLCTKRSVMCPYCELDKPLHEMEDHKLFCGSRTEKCSHCQKFILIKDLKQHELRHTKSQINESSNLSPSFASYIGDNIKNEIANNDIQQLGRDTYKIDYNEEKTSNDKKKKHSQQCNMKLIRDKVENCKKSTYRRFEDIQKTPRKYGQSSTKNKAETLRGRAELEDTVAGATVTSQLSNCAIGDKKESLSTVNFIASCPLCPMKFTMEMRRNHIIYCGKDYIRNVKLSCLLCRKELLAIDIVSHVMECKNNSYIIKCPLCKLQISVNEIQRHFSKCHRSNMEENIEFTCFICKNEVHINIAEDHVNYCNYVIKKSMKLPCPICKKEFLFDKIYNHIFECSQKVEERIKITCSTCKVELLINEINDCTRNFYQSNTKSVINSISEEQYPMQEIGQNGNISHCPWCSNVFSSNEVDYHVETCPNRQEECLKCGKPCFVLEKKNHQKYCFMKQ